MLLNSKVFYWINWLKHFSSGVLWGDQRRKTWKTALKDIFKRHLKHCSLIFLIIIEIRFKTNKTLQNYCNENHFGFTKWLNKWINLIKQMNFIKSFDVITGKSLSLFDSLINSSAHKLWIKFSVKTIYSWISGTF